MLALLTFFNFVSMDSTTPQQIYRPLSNLSRAGGGGPCLRGPGPRQVPVRVRGIVRDHEQGHEQGSLRGRDSHIDIDIGTLHPHLGEDVDVRSSLRARRYGLDRARGPHPHGNADVGQIGITKKDGMAGVAGGMIVERSLHPFLYHHLHLAGVEVGAWTGREIEVPIAIVMRDTIEEAHTVVEK